VRTDKRATSWTSLRDRLAAKRGHVPLASVSPEEVPVNEQSVVQPPWSAEHYPALDLMANWTNDRPSMSQILDGQLRQEAVDVQRESVDAEHIWRSDNATN
jgi:hypothetical protein